MLTRFYCSAFNFWNLKVRPVLGSIIPVTSHTLGSPDRRKLVWLGVTLKQLEVGPGEAMKTRLEDARHMRIVAKHMRDRSS